MIIIGAALIVIAVLLPTFLVPRLKVIPLDTVSTTVTEVREGSLLDSGALASVSYTHLTLPTIYSV